MFNGKSFFQKCLGVGILFTAAYFFVVLIFSPAFEFLIFSPEDPLFYYLNRESSLKEVGRCYTGLTSNWYRPTSFCLSYYVFMKFFDWHDLLALKLINWAFLAVELVGILLLSRCLSEKMGLYPTVEKSRATVAAALAAIYFGILPLHHIPSYHVTAFEFLSQALLVFCVYFFVSALNAREVNPRLFFASWGLYLVALTTKEPSVAIPGVLFAWSWIWWRLCGLSGKKAFWKTAALLSPFVVVTLIYLAVRLQYFPHFSSTGSYRIFSSWTPIRNNFWQLWNWSTWIFHKPFWHNDPYFPDRYFLAMGMGMLTLCIIGLSAFRLQEGGKKSLLFLGSAFLILAVIPINSGGYPWHFAPSAVFYSLFFGYCTEAALWHLRPDFKKVALGLVVLSIFAAGFRGYHSFMKGPKTYWMNWKALHEPPLSSDKIRPDTVLVIRNRGNFPWWELGIGHLFQYVYQQPALSEWNGARMNEDAKSRFLRLPSAYCVDWDIEGKSWVDVTEDCKREFQNDLGH